MSNKSRYKPKTRLYDISFADDHELAGLEIKMRALRLGELEKLGGLAEKFETLGLDEHGAMDDTTKTGSRIGVLGEMIGRLAPVLVSWNRLDLDTMRYDEETEEYEETEDTEYLPANADGLRRLEDWEFMAILSGYLQHAVGVSADLGKGSNSGQQSLAELPMTEL